MAVMLNKSKVVVSGRAAIVIAAVRAVGWEVFGPWPAARQSRVPPRTDVMVITSLPLPYSANPKSFSIRATDCGRAGRIAVGTAFWASTVQCR